jgi:hypothetical protein
MQDIEGDFDTRVGLGSHYDFWRLNILEEDDLTVKSTMLDDFITANRFLMGTKLLQRQITEVEFSIMTQDSNLADIHYRYWDYFLDDDDDDAALQFHATFCY